MTILLMLGAAIFITQALSMYYASSALNQAREKLDSAIELKTEVNATYRLAQAACNEAFRLEQNAARLESDARAERETIERLLDSGVDS